MSDDNVTVDTVAGTYVIEIARDEYAENPLTSWDQLGLAFYVYGRDSATTDTLSDAGAAGDIVSRLVSEFVDNRYRFGPDFDAVIRRYEKWRAISGSPWQLFDGSGNGYVQGDYWHWLVLIDTSYSWSAGIDKTVTATMDTYGDYARGDVYEFHVKAPDGAYIDGCSGFYGDSERDGYMVGEARSLIDYDVRYRVEKTNLVGAGFVGLI